MYQNVTHIILILPLGTDRILLKENKIHHISAKMRMLIISRKKVYIRKVV